MSIMKSQGCAKPLLLSIAMKDHSMSNIRLVIDQVKEMRVW